LIANTRARRDGNGQLLKKLMIWTRHNSTDLLGASQKSNCQDDFGWGHVTSARFGPALGINPSFHRSQSFAASDPNLPLALTSYATIATVLVSLIYLFFVMETAGASYL
jgi:hypothetical protein